MQGLGIYCAGALGGMTGDGGCYASAECEGTIYELFCGGATCTCEKNNAVTSTFAFAADAGAAACGDLLTVTSPERWFPHCQFGSP
jgi:hypothetical protein